MGVLAPAEHGRQSKVPDLNLAKMAVDKDVVALEVAVDDRRVVVVEVVEAIKYLARPVLDGPQAETPVSPPVLSKGTGGEHLGDEVEGPPGDVDPGGPELDDGRVAQSLEQVNLGVEPL